MSVGLLAAVVSMKLVSVKVVKKVREPSMYEVTSVYPVKPELGASESVPPEKVILM